MTGNQKTTSEERIRIARVTRPHGIRGAVRIELMGDDPDRFAPGTEVFVEETGERLVVEHAAPQPNGELIVNFETVTTRNGAEDIQHAYLVVGLDAARTLGENEWFVHDLIGMTVVIEDGTTLGTVADVESYVGNDVLVVTRPASPVLRIPMVKACVRSVDPGTSTITVSASSVGE